MGIMCSSGNSVTSKQHPITERPSSISSGNASDRLERMGVNRGKCVINQFLSHAQHFPSVVRIVECTVIKNGCFFLADLLAMSEYSSLLQLLCPDFPTEMVQNTARWFQIRCLMILWRFTMIFIWITLIFSFYRRIVLTEDATDCLMSFSDFIYSFQIQFYYEGN